MNTMSCQNQCFLKGYKSDVTSPQNCKNLISHFSQLSEEIYFMLSEKCAECLLYNRVHCGVVTARILEFALISAPQMRNCHHLNI
jgi:hypothetical protein